MGRRKTKKDRHGVSLRKLKQLDKEGRETVYVAQDHDTGEVWLRTDLADAPMIGKEKLADRAGYSDPDYLVRQIKKDAVVTELGDEIRSLKAPYGHIYLIKLPGDRGEVPATHQNSADVLGPNKRELETKARRARVRAALKLDDPTEVNGSQITPG